ncbi:MAG: tRNA (adenosine(37)-N6)-threonylcarbamoyltransferase complex dimerization subunit type 1 TsaB [Candidatus Saccharimonadota bacterium]|jgi:tRNA threonylcarbamoyladenosine biosynthesis protein TsaB
MILLLDTSTPMARLSFIDGEYRHDAVWEAGRGLAKGLLGYIQTELEYQEKSWDMISGLVAFKGPGSFTGLRIGITVLNTLASARNVPIVGVTGDDWRSVGVARIEAGENDGIVLPEYGGEANITTPRK